MVKYKHSINSIVVQDSDSSENEIISSEFEDDVENEIGEVIISAPQKINDTISLSVGQTMEIWRGFTTSTDKKIFDGRIIEIKPKQGIIEVIARNKLYNLVKKNVNKVYDESEAHGGKISLIAKDLIETYGGLTASVVDTGTEEGRTLKQFKCINTDIWERLQALKKAVNYQIRYDADNDIVHFEPRGFNETEKTLNVGTEIINIPDWDYDTSKLINSIRVDGASILTELRFPTSGTGEIGTTSGFETTGITLPKTPEVVKLTIDASDPPTTLREGGSGADTLEAYYYVDKENKKILPTNNTGNFTSGHFAFIDYTWASPVPILMENETSIDNLGGRPDGVYEKQMTLTDISSIADAEARAVEILARFSTPLVSAKISIRNTESLDLKSGDLIMVIDNISKPNVNRTFVITKRIIKFPGDIEELEIGDALLRIQDWEMQTEERIKRLEEELLRNQDLIVQLIQTNLTDNTAHNTKKSYTRYNIVKTQDYTTADNTMIWDNPCFTPDTEIITTQGIKNIKDCKMGDLVYSINPKTEKTEIKEIIDVQEFDHKGEIFCFKTDRVDFQVTPEHKFLLRRKKVKNWKEYDTKLEFTKARDLITRQYYFPKHLKADLGDKHNPDLLYFYGIYLSEGNLNRHKNKRGWKNGYSIFLAQSEEKNSFIYDKIENNLISLNIKYTKTIKGFFIHSKKILLELEKLFGKGSNKKFISQKILEEYDEESLRALFEGMYDGDGTKKVLLYSTTSKRLRDGFIQLITKLGYSFRYNYEKFYGNWNNKTDGIWRIFFKKGDNVACLCGSRGQRKWKKYKGKVYCVTVKDNHTVLAGRNGKFEWVGQSHGIWDTDNWATDANPDGFDDEEDVFIQNFDLGTANKYVEDFIDEDFKDENTTATWSGNGELVFS